ncbi:MAG: transposase [Amphritea sp.]
MPNYRRAWMSGGTYFFTVNLLQRQQSNLLVRHVDTLRAVVRDVRKRHPFIIHGWVVLPDHIHCIFSLPPEDSDFSLRWRLIKGDFSKMLPCSKLQSPSRQKRGERGIWQRRYWEHLIRDEKDLNPDNL